MELNPQKLQLLVTVIKDGTKDKIHLLLMKIQSLTVLKSNKSTLDGNTITDGTNTIETTSSSVTVKDNAWQQHISQRQHYNGCWW